VKSPLLREAAICCSAPDLHEIRPESSPARDRIGQPAKKSGCLVPKIAQNYCIPQLLLSNRTGESVLLNAAGRLCGLFLQSAEAQFGFDYSKGECNAITNRWFGESDLTLSALEAW
jgi:hypothetical protein